MRNQRCRLTELHKVCFVFYFLGDYESAGNPTNAFEGSLGPRGVAFPLGPGPLIMFVRRSSVGFAPIFGSVVNVRDLRALIDCLGLCENRLRWY